MRLYLDTNVLYFLLKNNGKELSNNVSSLLNDYGNTLHTSTVCVHELIHLYQTGKLPERKKRNGVNNPSDILERIRGFGISIIPINEYHLSAYAGLPILGNHKDPNDRLIISQAISDKITLISSDLKFSQYAKYGLDFILNKR